MFVGDVAVGRLSFRPTTLISPQSSVPSLGEEPPAGVIVDFRDPPLPDLGGGGFLQRLSVLGR